MSNARNNPPFPQTARELDALVFIKPAQMRLLKEIEACSQAIFRRADTVCPKSLDHLADVVRDAAGKYHILVAAGGDGTLNRMLQAQDRETLGTAVLPIGSGNDFARNFENPKGLRAKLDSFKRASWRQVDLLSVCGNVYHNSGGIGLDAATLYTRERAKGKLAQDYNVVFLRTLPGLKAMELNISLDGESHSGRFLWVLAMNNRWIGGGMLAAPRARFDDGLLDVLLVRDIPKWKLASLLPLIYRGAHVNHPAVRYEQAKSLIVESDNPITRLALDGELYGINETRIEFSVLPKALWVFGASK